MIETFRIEKTIIKTKSSRNLINTNKYHYHYHHDQWGDNSDIITVLYFFHISYSILSLDWTIIHNIFISFFIYWIPWWFVTEKGFNIFYFIFFLITFSKLFSHQFKKLKLEDAYPLSLVSCLLSLFYFLFWFSSYEQVNL